MALAVHLRELGVAVRVCAPPDFAGQMSRIGVPFVPLGGSVRELVHGAKPATPADAPRVAAALVASQFDTVGEAARGCDAVVATGLMPAGLPTVAETLGIPYVFVSLHPCGLPSPHHRPMSRPGKPFPPGVTDNRVLWDLDAGKVQALYGAALNSHRARLGLAPVDNVRDHVLTDHPWLAADPVLAPWPGSPDVDVVRTGAWMLRDRRPLPPELEAFLDAGAPPVYAGLGSVRVQDGVARAAIEAIRANGRRVVLGRGWARLAPIDDADDCIAVDEVNHQALFRRVAAVVHHGGAGTTTTAASAGVPQVVVPQIADQPYWAQRVADLGIGAAHDGPAPTTDSLSAALDTALAAEIRTRAAAVAGAIRTDGTAEAAALLTREVRARRAPS